MTTKNPPFTERLDLCADTDRVDVTFYVEGRWQTSSYSVGEVRGRAFSYRLVDTEQAPDIGQWPEPQTPDSPERKDERAKC